MKLTAPQRSVNWLFLLLIVATSGCFGAKQAIYLDPTFQQNSPNEITFLPAVDIRADKSIAVDTEKLVRGVASKILQRNGYSVNLTDSLGEISAITEDDLKSSDPAFLKGLGPPEERLVLLIALLDVSSTLTFGSTGNAEIAGFLYDRDRQLILWRDKGIGQVGMGGLIGMALKSLMAEDAIRIAVSDLLRSIPKREGVKEGSVRATSSPPTRTSQEAQKGLEASPDKADTMRQSDLPPQSSEQAFRELSEDLRKYEKLQQPTASDDERNVAWADLTKKYPQWTKEVPPGDTDAVRFRALQEGKTTQERIAAIPKETTRANLKRITLRNTPDPNYYENDLYKVIKDRNFFSKSYNPSGDFLNDFVDNGDGTVTDRVTGLMWQKEGSQTEITFETAKEYVRDLNEKRFAGYTNWRLPTIDELCSLLEPGLNKRGQHIDELFAGKGFACWSSDQKPQYTLTYAYVVYFGKGDVDLAVSRGMTAGWRFVRAVRTVN